MASVVLGTGAVRTVHPPMVECSKLNRDKQKDKHGMLEDKPYTSHYWPRATPLSSVELLNIPVLI